MSQPDIRLVISNKSDAYILERAKSHNIPHMFIEPRGADGKLKKREDYDKEVIAAIDSIEGGIDLILMIGYMRITSSQFVQHFKDRIYNVHPSLLPDFAGGMDLDVHKAVIESGIKQTGCTVHIVTEEVDSGPIIVQKRCTVEDGETSDTLKAKVQQLGTIMLADTEY